MRILIAPVILLTCLVSLASGAIAQNNTLCASGKPDLAPSLLCFEYKSDGSDLLLKHGADTLAAVNFAPFLKEWAIARVSQEGFIAVASYHERAHRLIGYYVQFRLGKPVVADTVDFGIGPRCGDEGRKVFVTKRNSDGSGFERLTVFYGSAKGVDRNNGCGGEWVVEAGKIVRKAGFETWPEGRGACDALNQLEIEIPSGEVIDSDNAAVEKLAQERPDQFDEGEYCDIQRLPGQLVVTPCRESAGGYCLY